VAGLAKKGRGFFPARIQKSKRSTEMRRRGKRTKGIEEAHPFVGMSQVNEDAAGIDIGAEEIVVCVAGDEHMQIVKAFGNYTVDLQNIGKWLKEHNVKSVAMDTSTSSVQEARACIGFRCLKCWRAWASNAC
jgi:hypothetical protein